MSRMHDDGNVATQGTLAPLKTQLNDAIDELRIIQKRLKQQELHVEHLRATLQNTCQHENVVSKRESGHYGRRYDECASCMRTW